MSNVRDHACLSALSQTALLGGHVVNRLDYFEHADAVVSVQLARRMIKGYGSGYILDPIGPAKWWRGGCGDRQDSV